jgi:molecular chaperone GrpE
MRPFLDFFRIYIREPAKSAFRRMAKVGARFLQSVSQAEATETQIQWKQKALDDFKEWLDEIPANGAATGEAAAEAANHAANHMDGCDLYALLSEFAALRQEIKLQNREQNRALRTQTDIVDAYRESLEIFKRKTADLTLLEEKIRVTCEKRTVLLFLDIRDALVRGLVYSREAAGIKSFFGRTPRQAKGIAEGYEMALRRFDRALSQLDIVYINTVNQPFDPKYMQALDRRKVPGTPPGRVVEEYSGGFLRENEVLRTAKVVVSE